MDTSVGASPAGGAATAAEARMRIRLCGNLAVQVDGRDAADALCGRQSRLLLAYLVVRRGEAISRDELIDAVWPERLPGAPQASLSSLLTGVRRALGRDALSGRSAIVLTLPSDAWIDVEAARSEAQEADSALAAGRAADALRRSSTALELTARPLLVGLDGDWVDRLRAEVGQLRCDQLENAVRAALALGNGTVTLAERLAKELIALEPYRESGYALLMEALARGGNVAEALRAFERVRALLRDELGVAPAATLTRLHERLLVHGRAEPAAGARSDPAPAAPALSLPLPLPIARGERGAFVGREGELRRLDERWAQVRRGQAELVLLTGEPGIGKTRLASRFAAQAHADGAAVVYGRADEDSVVPYQPFVEVLRHLVAHLGLAEIESVLGPRMRELRPLAPELVTKEEPGLPRGDPENRRYALFEAASALLAGLARRCPLVVVIEDLHWADKPALLLLREVVRHAEASPVLVLGTYRDVEVGAASLLPRVLSDLRRDQVLHRVSLTGFDESETTALVAALGLHGCAESVPALREYTAGNPFFIEETLRSIGELGPLESRSRADGVTSVPERVQDVIVERVERLAPATVELLTCASALGRIFSLTALAHLVERPAEAVLAGLEEAARAGLVQEHSERVGHFCFCHALVRDTVYGLPAPSRRQRLHLRAGSALEAARDGMAVHPGELAHHFFLARHVGGAERAVAYALEAAQEATGILAYEDAAGHFERALQVLPLLAGSLDELRTEILLALGGVRWQGGEPGAREAFEDAAEVARRRRDGPALVRAALGAGGRFYAPGRPDPSYVELLEEALDTVDPDDFALRARVLGRLTEARGGGRKAPEAALEAISLARGAGDGAALAEGLLSRHAGLLHVRHLDERLAVAEEAVALADDLRLRETAALARHWLIYDLTEAGALAAARDRHVELQRLARELQQPLYQHSALAWGGVWAQLAGRFDEAERLAREGLRLAERAGARDARAHFTAQLLAVRREQGRLPELLPTLGRLADERSDVIAWNAVLPLAQLEAGEHEHAAASLSSVTAADFASIPDGSHWLPAMAWLAEAAAALGHAGACATLLARLEAHAGRFVQAGFTGCWGAVDRLLGVLAGATGRHDEAQRHLRTALDLHVALGAGPLAARTRRDLARLAGRPADAA